MTPVADPPPATSPGASTSQPRELRTVRQTTCCVVGAGPAGAMLALLLARQAVPVTLLEAHGDFDRDFRGDSLHPAIMRVLDELGLADQLLELPHRKLRQATLPANPPITVDLSRLPGRFPYITLMPQARFLEFLTGHAARYPSFEVLMRANVRELVEQDGIVRGVRYHTPDGWHEVRAALTVGADGRFSQIRRLSGLQPVITAATIDVLWFRLPRLAGDPEGATGGIGGGRMLLLVDRGEVWQVGMLIHKGSWPQLRAAGLGALRRTIVELVPWLADRIDELADWTQVSLLSVTSDYLPRWYRPGLLLIGDAAHVMSPVAGNGINYAIADAVAAANLLARPLATGQLTEHDLAAVQRRRQWPTRITQKVVGVLQDRLLARALRSATGPPKLVRALLRVPLLRDVAPRLAAFGARPEHVLPPPAGNQSR
jgi:2-polyprenyl-6-methoxyphenol hydroxylase-like FAD-dependent oxidoreductase